MKNTKYKNLSLAIIFGAFIITGCERSPSDDVRPATFSTTAEIFTDNFVGLGSDFYFPYLGAKPDVFSVDSEVAYESDASIRIDVPNADDPGGNFAGAIFRVDGAGRNLTGYDALTFWAKASQAVTVNEFGFGQNFNGDALRVVLPQVDLTTQWKKYIIPIPDPSVLVEERGMFQFAAGGIGAEGQEVGYTFWVDELKFEKLGTIAQPRPSILNGASTTETAFVGGTLALSNFTQTFNLANGSNATVIATPAYFDFRSSNRAVATVDASGQITVIGGGTTEVTASLAGVLAKGSATIESLGTFLFAPEPTLASAEVISIFSDIYTDSPAALISDFGSFQTSSLTTLEIGGRSVLNYQNVNFFGIVFNGDIPTIDGSEMTNLHLDILIPNSIASNAFLELQLRNVGSNGIIETNEFTGQPTGDDTEVRFTPNLVSNQWISVDLNISGLADRSALGQIVFVSPDAGPNNFYVDNVYFSK